MWKKNNIKIGKQSNQFSIMQDESNDDLPAIGWIWKADSLSVHV